LERVLDDANEDGHEAKLGEEKAEGDSEYD
jgi:hypothetical protein